MEKEIEGWVLKSDLETLGSFSNAIVVFTKNFLGDELSNRFKKVTLTVHEDNGESSFKIKGLSWSND